MNDARFLLGYIARQAHVTAAEALALAATDPVLPVAVRALAAETALDARLPAPAIELRLGGRKPGLYVDGEKV